MASVVETGVKVVGDIFTGRFDKIGEDLGNGVKKTVDTAVGEVTNVASTVANVGGDIFTGRFDKIGHDLGKGVANGVNLAINGSPSQPQHSAPQPTPHNNQPPNMPLRPPMMPGMNSMPMMPGMPPLMPLGTALGNISNSANPTLSHATQAIGGMGQAFGQPYLNPQSIGSCRALNDHVSKFTTDHLPQKIKKDVENLKNDFLALEGDLKGLKDLVNMHLYYFVVFLFDLI